MASMYTGYYNNARFYVDWSEGEKDTANNKTLIHWTAGLEAYPGRSSYWYTNAVKINYLYFDNSGNLASGTWSNIILDNGARAPLRSGSLWVAHNTDGTKALNGSFSGWLFDGGDMGTSGSWNLTAIPRNSQVSTDKASYTLGEPITIYTNRLSTSYTHSILIRQNNYSGTVLKTFSSVGASVTWTPTTAEISTMQQMIPNSKTLTIYIQQYNNQAFTESSTTKPLTIANANPEFSNFTFRDINTSVVNITGSNQVLVKGKSTLETRISFEDRMVAIKDASPVKYSISYDGTTREEPYSGVGNVNSTFTPNSIGQRTILVSAVDSRNNNTSVSKMVTVYDYEDPTIESKLVREDSFGSDTTLSLAGDWSPVTIDGVEKNELTAGSLRYRYTEDGVPFANNWVTRSFTVDGTRWAMDQDYVISLDNTKKYLFEFEIADEFGTILTTDVVNVGIPIMFIGENDGIPSVGVGKLPEQGALDVDGDIYSNGEHIFLAVHPVGSIYMSVSGVNPGTVFGGTWVAWGSGRVPVGVDTGQTEFNTVEETGGAKTHTLTTTEMPVHAHTVKSDIVHGDGEVVTSEILNVGIFWGSGRRRYTNISYNAGSGGAHNNLQPYITCYMWKRTA